MIESTKILEGTTRHNFPKLMVSYLDQSVVLFRCEKEGTVVGEGNNSQSQPVGCYIKNWAMSVFSDYDGTIELKNVE